MQITRWHRTAYAMGVAAIMMLASACGTDATLGPRDTAAFDRGAARGAALGACGQLRAPEGSVVAAHLYARGVQIYRWTGASWAFDGPSAALYADAGFTGQVGTHSAGPIWVHAGGSTVRGSSPVACTVDASAIPWLLLQATPESDAGIFGRVIAIQRVNTVGGRAPSTPGAAPGEIQRVPYTAEYYFYR